jgi:hypothetical protein
MKRYLAYSLIATALCVSPVMAQAGGRGFPLQVVSTTVVGEEVEFGSIVAAAVGPEGNVYVVDHMNCAVLAFSPNGRMLWKVGRKGAGPGEYQLPYRITTIADSTILVFDLATGDVTTLGSNGRFITRARLPERFPYVNDILATPGEMWISGVVSTAGQRRLRGIHRFRRTAAGFVQAGSFGPLPPTRDTVVVRFWGAGDIARGRSGDLIYALNLPYVIYRYDPAGRQRAAVRSPVRVRGTPDEAFKIQRTERGMSIEDAERSPDYLSSVVEVHNGLVMVSRTTSQSRHWDLYTATGAFLSSREVPSEWGVAVGFDPARGFLWMVATHDDAPVLVRLQLAAGARSRTATSARRDR